ncbi:UDP-N-acetylglucosamine--LPS N-acetylglucosamine transferase [Alsobacter soli]|uniref:UDP-N-acetylglucosamine--LPS N-acetylglucosamine transferase n=1 Tax=Alsobacter soli TaxID=2109933 RepID=A0A2T1HLH3_9HYPH|nr:UDP-N-acetylglucosamine--LPS N-acetylglucosamine transferase [Alsobacter soli]PSC02429.1 UDP-N-acetylglucosamine--LPS N-acetylglucosamine transferase [Alsobacter soli]
MGRLRPALSGASVAFVSTNPDHEADVQDGRFYAVRDASLSSKLGLVAMTLQLFRIVLKERPQYVISTGAAPGYIAIRLARLLFKARTIWVDSIANVDQLSTSGQKIGKHADLWLTQWPHLANDNGPNYVGAVV